MVWILFFRLSKWFLRATCESLVFSLKWFVVEKYFISSSFKIISLFWVDWGIFVLRFVRFSVLVASCCFGRIEGEVCA